jgi:glycerophosphoryl diester phosphodiesterase
LVARIREKSAFVGVWTVNDVERAHVLAKMGVEILISDDPGPLVASFT